VWSRPNLKFESRALVFITKNGAFEIRDSRDEDVIKTTALASTSMGRGIWFPTNCSTGMWHRRGNIRWHVPLGKKIHRYFWNPLRNGLLDSQLLGLLLTGVDDEADPPLLKNPVVSSHMFVLFSYVIYYSSIPAMSSATSQCSTVIVNDNVESIHSEAERAILTLIRCNSTKGIPQIHRFVPSSSHKKCHQYWPIDHQYFPVELVASEEMVFDTGRRSAGRECDSSPLSTFLKLMLRFHFKSAPEHSRVLLVSNFFLENITMFTLTQRLALLLN